jgi:hypothetical protein
MTPYQALMEDAASMTPAQLRTFTTGVELISRYQAGSFMGRPGKPRLLVSAHTDMELMFNAMAYLSKFCPASDLAFPALYRIHDFSLVRGPKKPGSTMKVKPFRSFLSWSADPKISVAGVDDHYKEGLLGINGSRAKIVFSYKVVKRIAPARDVPDKLAQLYGALRSLHNSADDWESEAEVIVYHAKPFTARLLRIVDAGATVKDLVKQLELSKYLSNPTKVSGGLSFTIKDQAVNLVFDILKRRLGLPSSRMSNAKVKKWLGDKHRFVLEIKTHELTITNLKR